MHIEKVRTAKHVGKFILRKDNSPNLIDIKYKLSLPISILEDDSPRVYLITVNDIIKKIGGSSGKGGIKNTISFYINARTGSPGPARFVIHGLIAKELREGKNVDLYMITSQKVKAKICGLLDCNEEIEISSFKEMEDLCKFDYLVYNLELNLIRKKIQILDNHIKKCLYQLSQKLKALKNLKRDFHNAQEYILNAELEKQEDLIINLKRILKRNLFLRNLRLPQGDYDLEELKILVLELLKNRYRKIIAKPKEKIKRELSYLNKKGFIIKPFPEWNFQENGDPYPEDLYKEYLKYHEKRVNT